MRGLLIGIVLGWLVGGIAGAIYLGALYKRLEGKLGTTTSIERN